tara:strand:- start:292 stop:429 length:138 start_codon:yes stop_codon:yes gene_type:complete
MRTIFSVLKIEDNKVTLKARPKKIVVPLSRCKFVDRQKRYFVTLK